MACCLGGALAWPGAARADDGSLMSKGALFQALEQVIGSGDLGSAPAIGAALGRKLEGGGRVVAHLGNTVTSVTKFSTAKSADNAALVYMQIEIDKDSGKDRMALDIATLSDLGRLMCVTPGEADHEQELIKAKVPDLATVDRAKPGEFLLFVFNRDSTCATSVLFGKNAGGAGKPSADTFL